VGRGCCPPAARLGEDSEERGGGALHLALGRDAPVSSGTRLKLWGSGDPGRGARAAIVGGLSRLAGRGRSEGQIARGGGGGSRRRGGGWRAGPAAAKWGRGTPRTSGGDSHPRRGRVATF
jgi:hypothetical protein